MAARAYLGAGHHAAACRAPTPQSGALDIDIAHRTRCDSVTLAQGLASEAVWIRDTCWHASFVRALVSDVA